MKKLPALVFIIFSLFLSKEMFAQEDKKTNPFLADQKFNNGNFEAALEDYLFLLEYFTINFEGPWFHTLFNNFKKFRY